MTSSVDTPAAAHRELDLTTRQLHAIDAFHRARRGAERAAEVAARSRETRMDASRRLDVVRREHEALIARTHEQLRMSQALLHHSRPTAVVAHRSGWFAGKVAELLGERGLQVVALVDNGADAVGAAIAEQPDLVIVEDTLAMVPGEEVVREVREFCPQSVIAAQTAYADGVEAMLAAGATTAFTRRLRPAEAVDLVLAELAGQSTGSIHAR